jgi:hypothetical protein
MPTNELYLAVLPFVHIRELPFQTPTQQVLTLFPDRRFATEFFPDEVKGYVERFRSAATNNFTGGHVISYEFIEETTGDGRVVVRVVQHVR